MSERMKVTVTDENIEIDGLEIPIPWEDQELHPTEAILIVRSVGLNPDGSRFDALDYTYSTSTTHMIRRAMLSEADNIEVGDLVGYYPEEED